MFYFLFMILMFYIFGKLFFFGMRAAWSISKLLITIVFLPVILIGMLLAGLLSAAFPLLVVALVVAFIVSGWKRV